MGELTRYKGTFAVRDNGRMASDPLRMSDAQVDDFRERVVAANGALKKGMGYAKGHAGLDVDSATGWFEMDEDSTMDNYNKASSSFEETLRGYALTIVSIEE